MSRLLLLANPSASGFTGGLHRDVMTILRASHEAETVWPNGVEDTVHTAAKAAADGIEIVAAMGGDGVVHHVANGLVGTDSALAIIPAGTTNVFADILHVPSDSRDAARFVATHPPAWSVPMIRIQLDERPPFYGAFAAGVGYDASVVEEAEKEPYRKYRFGGVHYARTAVSVLWRGYRSRLPTIRLTASGEAHDAVAVLAQAHHPYTYFGKVPLTLAPGPPDGLHVAALGSLPARRAPSIAVGAMFGRGLGGVKDALVLENVDAAEVVCDPPSAVQADGELLGNAGYVLIEHVPDALNVVAPPPEPVRARWIRRKRAAD